MKAKNHTSLPVLVIGGGMITRDVIMPTLFQLRRYGQIGEVIVASRRAATIKRLQELFPKSEFSGYPDPEKHPPDESHSDIYKQALADLPSAGAVIVATPDHLHTEMILETIRAGHHLIVQKPLCLKVAEVHAIQQAANERGIYVLTDFHKRHDPAIRGVKYKYGQGELGKLLHGHAWIEERREIPLEHFALWCEKSSPFEYIGVHYADAYYFITGLKPKRVIGFGQKKLLLPDYGKDAFDAVQAVITWEDDSVLWIQTAWVCSQYNSALTNQGLQLLGTEGEYWADHKDRNCRFVTQRHGYEDYNPNFFKTFDSFDSDAEYDVRGYGYESIKQGIDDINFILGETRGLDAQKALERRREIIALLEPKRALPGQALISTAIAEAVRLSIDNQNRAVVFDEGMYPRLLTT